MRIIPVLAMSIILAGTTSDVFKTLNVDKSTSLQEAEESLAKATAEYNSISKQFNNAEILNWSIASIDRTSIQEELNTQTQILSELTTTIPTMFDSTISEILEADKKYIDTLDNCNNLYNILDSYSILEESYLPTDELTDKSNTLTEVKNTTEELLNNSDIGITKQLIHPVQAEYSIVSKFGTRVLKEDVSKSEKHTGLDIAGDTGTGVLSLWAGKVVYADWSEDYGEKVIIDHGDGLKTIYYTLGERYVREGDIVKQYQKIGTIGESHESVKESHLHLEITIDDISYDPELILKGE